MDTKLSVLGAHCEKYDRDETGDLSLSLSLSLYTCMYVCICICKCKWKCLCLCLCLYLCLYVCMYVCMYVCIYVCMYCIVLYCTVLYCTVLYCIVLYCIVLHCIVLHCVVFVLYLLYCMCAFHSSRKRRILNSLSMWGSHSRFESTLSDMSACSFEPLRIWSRVRVLRYPPRPLVTVLGMANQRNLETGIASKEK